MNPSPFDAMVSHITGSSGGAVGKKRDQGVVKSLNDGRPGTVPGVTPGDAPGAAGTGGPSKILTEEERVDCIQKCNDAMKASDRELAERCKLVREKAEKIVDEKNKELYKARLKEDEDKLVELKKEVEKFEVEEGVPAGSCLRCFTLRSDTIKKTFFFLDKDCTEVGAALTVNKRRRKGGCARDVNFDGVPDRQPFVLVPVEDKTKEELQQLIGQAQGALVEDDESLGDIDDDSSVGQGGVSVLVSNPNPNGGVNFVEDIDTKRAGYGFPYVQPALRRSARPMYPSMRSAYPMPYMQPTRRLPVKVPRRVKHQYV
jgi:hypothetical protein